jgi:hypothetical protein
LIADRLGDLRRANDHRHLFALCTWRARG